MIKVGMTLVSGWNLLVFIIILAVGLAGCAPNPQVAKDIETFDARRWDRESRGSPTDWGIWMDLQGGGR